MGGKYRIAKYLSPIILATKPRVVVEPFCGALNVTVRLLMDDTDVVVHAYDAHCDLIDMWRAVQAGWEPPTNLGRDEYNALRNSEASPLRTFAGYGCSFSGKWFGGYASNNTGRNYALNAHNSIMRRAPFLSRVIFNCRSYEAISDFPENSVIYCDPPYAGTTDPGEQHRFDHVAFWRWVNARTVPCYVSEYVAPPSQPLVWEREVKTDMRTNTGKAERTERLFINQGTTSRINRIEGTSDKN